MRVTVVSHTYVVAANHGKLEELARMPEVELSVICPRKIRRQFGVYPVERTAHSAYRIVPLRALYHSHNCRFLYLGLARALSRLAPDILHLEEEPWSLAAWQALRFKRRHPATRFVFFTWENRFRRWGFPHAGVERAVLREADAAIAGNAEAAEVLRKKGFEREVEVIPQLGLDADHFTKRDESQLREELGLRGTAVGFAGRLVPEKGIGLLLEALAGLEGDWSLLVVGGGPMLDEVRARLSKPPFAGRATLLPTVPHAEMPRYLNCMDILVLPSVEAPHWKEQFGHVLIEAMSCEVPVVGSSCGEVPNVIGEAGVVFPEGDVEALRSSLARLLASPEERHRLGRAGRQRVAQNYTDRTIAARTMALWQRVVGGGEAAG